MPRVLVTGAAGTIGSAVVRRLLAEPDLNVRVSDERQAPDWMRATCEVHNGDLRELEQARAATAGCRPGDPPGGDRRWHCQLPQAAVHPSVRSNAALYNAVFRAALDHDVERLLYVSSSMVFERATEFPTTEAHIDDCPTPRSAYGFSKLTGEIFTLAAHEEFGLPYTICRPFNAYSPGEMPGTSPGSPTSYRT